MDGNHIHLYREDFEDKWAFQVDPTRFSNLSNIKQTFVEFCGYCSIANLPPFQGGLI